MRQDEAFAVPPATDIHLRHERANLWVICAAQFLTLGGMTAVLPLIPLYLQQIGVSDRDALKYWTGAIGSAPFAVAVFTTPIWGALADRFGHKPMVVRSVFGIAFATVGMGFAYTPLALLGWRGVQGAVSGVFPAAVALVSALTPEERLSHSLAVLQTARAGGWQASDRRRCWPATSSARSSAAGSPSTSASPPPSGRPA